MSVMSLWKLRVGVEAYYLSQVASGLDEYYTGAGEAPGNWIGGGVAGLGIIGEVSPADLRAVLAGLAPNTGLTPNGTRLATHPRRVPGFDLTFSVPKSVSVLYALGVPLVQHAVTEACETALAEALGWFESEACFVRRGTNKAENKQTWGVAWGTRRMVAAGFVAASSRHRFGIARRGLVIRICTGMSWSRTWRRASTAAGPPSTAPPCTRRSAPSVSCSRP